jgi:hypothetical protein
VIAFNRSILLVYQPTDSTIGVVDSHAHRFCEGQSDCTVTLMLWLFYGDPEEKINFLIAKLVNFISVTCIYFFIRAMTSVGMLYPTFPGILSLTSSIFQALYLRAHRFRNWMHSAGGWLRIYIPNR